MNIEKRHIESADRSGDFWVITRNDGRERLSYLFDTKREAKLALADIERGNWNHSVEISEWV